MPLHTDIDIGTFNKFYESFSSQYPSIYHRYAQAYDLAQGAGLGPEDQELMVGKYAASQWGEYGVGLQKAANFGWGLSKAVKFSAEEPVMVFREGTPEDVLAEDDMDGEVTIDWGLISVPKLVHDYDGNITRRGPAKWLVRPPYFFFGISIPVRDPRRISGDMTFKSLEINKIEKQSRLNASVGAVTLRPSIEEYWKYDTVKATGRPRYGRNVTERHVIVGSSACAPVLEMLRVKASRSTDRIKRDLKQMAV